MDTLAGFKELSVFPDFLAANGVNQTTADMGRTAIEQYLFNLPFTDTSAGEAGAGVISQNDAGLGFVVIGHGFSPFSF